MTIVFPAAYSLRTQSALVNPVDGSSSNTDDLVVLADTDIRSTELTIVRILLVFTQSTLAHPQPMRNNDR